LATIIGIYLLVLAGALVVVVLRDHARGTVELLSVRNVAIAGFILFQLTSAAMALFNPSAGGTYYHLDDPAKTGLVYAGMVSVFMLVAHWAYWRGWGIQKLAWRVPATQAVPGDAVLLAMAVILTILAALLRFTVRVPVVNILSNQFGSAFAALACAVVGWVWGRRLLNPVLILYCSLIVAMNIGIVMSLTFGRRTLIGLAAGLIWGMYYSYWRSMDLRPMLQRLTVLSIPLIIVVALFTSARKEFQTSTGKQLMDIRARGDVMRGLADLASGQNCGGVSLWLVEDFPDRFPRRHLMTIWHFLIYPVPRLIWPDKPISLGRMIPRILHIRHVAVKETSIGAGIVGTANAEGGWYALVIYALLGGLLLRFLDEVVLSHDSPFVVLPVGCSLGQILGLARGETSAFTFLLLTNTAVTLFSMVLIGRFLEATNLGGTAQRPPDDEGDEQEEMDPASAEQYGTALQ
jgi:hypothetical protein